MSWHNVLKRKRTDRKKKRNALSPSTRDLDYIDSWFHADSRLHWKRVIKEAKIKQVGGYEKDDDEFLFRDTTNRQWAQMALNLDPEFEIPMPGDTYTKLKTWYHGDMR